MEPNQTSMKLKVVFLGKSSNWNERHSLEGKPPARGLKPLKFTDFSAIDLKTPLKYFKNIKNTRTPKFQCGLSSPTTIINVGDLNLPKGNHQQLRSPTIELFVLLKFWLACYYI